MIIGLYLVAPILQKVIAATSTNRIILICAASLIIAAVETAGGTHPGAFFYQFAPYLGYFLAGYCLYKKSKNIDRHFLMLAVVLCGGVIAVFTGILLLITSSPWNYTYGYLNPVVIVMSLSLFALVAGRPRLSLSAATDRVVGAIAPLTLGIYVIHPAWLDVLYRYRVNGFFLHPLIGIPATTLIAFGLSALSTFCFLAIPGLRRAVA